jgi:translation initiation factor RLI1
MPNTLVSLDYSKCRPDLCNNGICIAVAECQLKVIGQEEKFDFPMANPSLCKGCAKCTAACPYGAISLI